MTLPKPALPRGSPIRSFAFSEVVRACRIATELPKRSPACMPATGHPKWRPGWTRGIPYWNARPALWPAGGASMSSVPTRISPNPSPFASPAAAIELPK